MARRFWDSFGSYNTTVGSRVIDNPQWVYDSAGGTAQYATAAGLTRFGYGQSLEFTNTNGDDFGLMHPVPASEYFKFAVAHMNPSAGQSVSFMGVSVTASLTSSHIGLMITSTGKLQLVKYTGSAFNLYTVLADSWDGHIAQDSWHHYSWCGRIHDTLGFVTIYIDGFPVPDLTVSGVDTKNSGAGDVNYLWIGNYSNPSGGSASDRYFQDFVEDDDTDGSVIPERRVYQLQCNADGATLDLTPSAGGTHYGVVDEAVVDLTDYLSGSVVGDLDLLGMTDLPFVPDSIDGIIIKMNSAKTDATARALNAGFESDGVVTNGSDYSQATTPAFYLNGPHLTDPATGIAWTVAGIDAIQAQPRVAV